MSMTKSELAEKLGISRPTLDVYLRTGLPKKIKENNIKKQDYEAIEMELIHLRANRAENLIKIKYLNQSIEEIDTKIIELENYLKEGK